MSKIIFDYEAKLTIEVDAEWTPVQYPTFTGPARGGIGQIKAWISIAEAYNPLTKTTSYSKIDVWQSLPEHVQEKIENEIYYLGREQDAEKLDRVD